MARQLKNVYLYHWHTNTPATTVVRLYKAHNNQRIAMYVGPGALQSALYYCLHNGLGVKQIYLGYTVGQHWGRLPAMPGGQSGSKWLPLTPYPY